MSEYAVVFSYTEKALGWKGVRTWRTFPDKGKFDEFCATDEGKEYLSVREIVGKGITAERAGVLAKAVPFMCLADALINDAFADQNLRNPLGLHWAIQKLQLVEELQKKK